MARKESKFVLNFAASASLYCNNNAGLDRCRVVVSVSVDVARCSVCQQRISKFGRRRCTSREHPKSIFSPASPAITCKGVSEGADRPRFQDSPLGHEILLKYTPWRYRRNRVRETEMPQKLKGKSGRQQVPATIDPKP